MKRKSQAALEFLTTYGWAFLVITITVGALYSFGIFDFSKFLPQKCQFPSQLDCIDYSFSGNQVRLRLINNLGETINVNSFSITNDASSPLSCTAPLPFNSWLPSEERDLVFSSCVNGAFIRNQRVEAKITVKFCAPATSECPEHVIMGKITAVVN